MTAIIAPIEDKLFGKLADLLLDCSLRKQNGCKDCRRLKVCLRWWDIRVCTHCEQHNLKPEYLEIFSLEFAKVRNGTNGYGRYLSVRLPQMETG